MTDDKPKVISLFSGAGGLDIGFEAAGFEIAVAVELDSSCCETLRCNRPNTCVINKDISDVAGEEILSASGLNVGEAALVIGGPPCQSFSLAGLRKGLDDDRGKLLFEFVRIVRETLPIWVSVLFKWKLAGKRSHFEHRYIDENKSTTMKVIIDLEK